ncbi:MAG: CCA tRNA nucleotidyltransferase [Candidatus Wallbacteria bacterium]|nr:CCA tRNA nucleotidyltransferase [Candidatus Wallbacteria bacterium]
MRGALHILATLRAAGFQAYVVGGSVRDRELGLEPQDHDIATDATPDRVLALFPKVIPTGVKHGTVTVIVEGVPYEVTTFRRDVECHGRHATVEHTTSLQEDLSRRDFTVNAMACDPETGQVIDPFGGREDLTRRVIRCVGDPPARFEEDHLRVLRAIRFAAQLDFEIEPATWAALLEKAPLLERISQERIAHELWGVLAGRAVWHGVRLLDQAGILARLLPELAATRGVTQPPRYHHLDVFEHTMLALQHAQDSTPDPVTRLAVLLHDIGKPATRSTDHEAIHFHGHEEVGARLVPDLVARLRLAASSRIHLDTKELTDRLQKLIRLHLRPSQLHGAKGGALRRFVREAGLLLDELLLVVLCDRLAHREPDIEALDRLKRDIAALGPASHIHQLRSPLSGHEIMRLLGLQPGKALGEAKDALVDAIVSGEVPDDREAAERWLLARFGRVVTPGVP